MAAYRTRSAILTAARTLIAGPPPGSPLPSVGAVAPGAGVSRLSIYHHFGSKAALERAIAEEAGRPRTAPPPGSGALERLRHRIATACGRWSSDPRLFRRLPSAAAETTGPDHDPQLAIELAESDLLRPGWSLREAEDVIGVVTSFAAFDRLYGDGRRSLPAVIEILNRMAGSILRPQP